MVSTVTVYFNFRGIHVLNESPGFDLIANNNKMEIVAAISGTFIRLPSQLKKRKHIKIQSKKVTQRYIRVQKKEKEKNRYKSKVLKS